MATYKQVYKVTFSFETLRERSISDGRLGRRFFRWYVDTCRTRRERGERIGGIKQTYKEELMRIRAYGWQSALPCQVAPLE